MDLCSQSMLTQPNLESNDTSSLKCVEDGGANPQGWFCDATPMMQIREEEGAMRIQDPSLCVRTITTLIHLCAHATAATQPPHRPAYFKPKDS